MPVSSRSEETGGSRSGPPHTQSLLQRLEEPRTGPLTEDRSLCWRPGPHGSQDGGRRSPRRVGRGRHDQAANPGSRCRARRHPAIVWKAVYDAVYRMQAPDSELGDIQGQAEAGLACPECLLGLIARRHVLRYPMSTGATLITPLEPLALALLGECLHR
jgi:hypothetical protein